MEREEREERRKGMLYYNNIVNFVGSTKFCCCMSTIKTFGSPSLALELGLVLLLTPAHCLCLWVYRSHDVESVIATWRVGGLGAPLMLMPLGIYRISHDVMNQS